MQVFGFVKIYTLKKITFFGMQHLFTTKIIISDNEINKKNK